MTSRARPSTVCPRVTSNHRSSTAGTTVLPGPELSFSPGRIDPGNSAFEASRKPLAGEFNLTSDVIVGFPAEDEAAFANTLATVESAGLTKVHVFPYSPRPGTRTAADDAVPAAAKKERSARLRALSHELCLRRWHAKLGAEDTVLVDRPGRGYGDDYSPWLVPQAAPVGELLGVRGVAVSEEGILAA